jgi:alginate O-acetyltransferase complex protein AlgJ
MAFSPLVDYLSRWNPGAASRLEDARIAVMSESWGQPKSMQTTYQQITTVYLHMAGPNEPDPGLQWWVKVEFHPWATLFGDMPDSDKDGVPEMYGRLRRGIVSSEVEARVKEDYLSRELSGDEVRRWLNELASYWYPSYNTDVAIAGRTAVFPNEETEPEIAQYLEGTQVTGVLFALRGKPDRKLIYNVFVVDGVSAVESPKSAAMADSGAPSFEVSSQTSELLELLRAERREQGGENYETWAEKLEPLHKKIRGLLAKRSAKRKGFVGKDGWLFFRGSLQYVVGGDLRLQGQGKNPFAPSKIPSRFSAWIFCLCRSRPK